MPSQKDRLLETFFWNFAYSVREAKDAVKHREQKFRINFSKFISLVFYDALNCFTNEAGSSENAS